MVEGYGNTGGLIGFADRAEINQVYSTNRVKGAWYIGGLIGSIGGETVLIDAFSSSDVEGISYVGGITGFAHSPKSENVYAVGEVKGEEYVGGVIGVLNDGDVKNIFALNRSVAGERNVGKVVGYFSNINLSSNNVFIYNGMTSIPTTHDDDYNRMYDSSDLLLRDTFENLGFTFDEIWNIDEGETLPYLSFDPERINFDGYGYAPIEIPETPELTISNQTSSSISLQWEDTEGAVEYVLERRLKPVSIFSALSLTAASEEDTTGFEEVYRGTTTSFIDNTVNRGSRYEYRLQAVNEAGASDPSIQEAFTYQIVTFNWFPIKDEEGNDAIEYIVQRNGGEIG